MNRNPMVNTRILNLLLHLKNTGYCDLSITTYNNFLKIINKRLDLDKPEEVKKAIANMNGSTTYKQNLCKAYKHYTNTIISNGKTQTHNSATRYNVR